MKPGEMLMDLERAYLLANAALTDAQGLLGHDCIAEELDKAVHSLSAAYGLIQLKARQDEAIKNL